MSHHPSPIRLDSLLSTLVLMCIITLDGSNVIKVIPSNGNASGVRVTDKRLKVICGANTSYLADGEWIGDKTPLTFAEVRVSPFNTVKPNVGTIELSEALAKVLPFTSKDENRPIFQCVKFEAKEGKLRLVSADGFRLAVVTLDYEDGEAEALINASELKGIANALKRAKRTRVSFASGGEKLTSRLVLPFLFCRRGLVVTIWLTRS